MCVLVTPICYSSDASICYFTELYDCLSLIFRSSVTPTKASLRETQPLLPSLGEQSFLGRRSLVTQPSDCVNGYILARHDIEIGSYNYFRPVQLLKWFH